MKQPKYQYCVKTWGGFYNKEFQKIHKLKEGDFVFDTEEQRDEFIEKRKRIEQDLNARRLMIVKSEGFSCSIPTVLHRVIEFEGKQYYSSRKLRPNYPFQEAKFLLKNKWYPGFIDYPLGPNFDYSKVKTVGEWITGAFQIEEEDEIDD